MSGMACLVWANGIESGSGDCWLLCCSLLYVFIILPSQTFNLHSSAPKLQALVYDILPSTTAVFSYAIGSENCQLTSSFFAGAETIVSLLQTTQIKQGVSFIAANKVYTSTNKKNRNGLNRDGTLFFTPGWMRLICLRARFGARLLLRSY